MPITYKMGQTVSIRWTADNVPSGSTISLCYDTDTRFNGNEHWIEINKVTASDGTGTYTWNTAGVATGTYYLAGYLWNGTTPTFSHQATAITLVASTSSNTTKSAALNALFARIGNSETDLSPTTNSAKADWLYDV